MKKAAWFVIWLFVTYFYIHVCVWIANNHSIWVSVPVIWITMSIWGCVWWWRMNTYLRSRKHTNITTR